MVDADGAGLGLRDGFDLSGLSRLELWLIYVSIGGAASIKDLADEIATADAPGEPLDAHEYNLVAQSLNEHFLDVGLTNVVGYRLIDP